MKKPEQLAGLEEMLCRAANIKVASLKSPSKVQKIVDVRHTLWCIAYDHLGLAYAQIALYYNRDATAIMYGAKRMRGSQLVSTVIVNIRAKKPELLENVLKEPGDDWGEI